MKSPKTPIKSQKNAKKTREKRTTERQKSEAVMFCAQKKSDTKINILW